MMMFNYFFKDFKIIIYFFISLILSLFFRIITNTGDIVFFELILPVFLVLLILRLQDDISDYEKDKGHKAQHLSKKQLVLLEIIFSCVFLAVNLWLYRLNGAYTVFVIIYIQFLEKIKILKILFGASLFAMYALLNSVTSATVYIVGITIIALLSTFFYFIKLRK